MPTDLFQAFSSAAHGATLTPYPASMQPCGNGGLALVRTNAAKCLVNFAASEAALNRHLEGDIAELSGVLYRVAPLTHANAELLRTQFPWTAPLSLRDRQTTIGCGDRLGRATPGHIRAVRQFPVSPVLAQQSIRELNLTGRTYENVVDDVTFLVFQEGYTDGFGADGDHLKTLADINMAIDAGMAMITLDLSEVMLAEAENWSAGQIETAFGGIPAETRQRLVDTYADKTFQLGDSGIAISALECKRCAVMYSAALDFAREVYDLLKKRRGDAFDLEISIDETTAPTLPSHHLFIIKEILVRGIEVSSLAPRFIGEFQKAIDYIGDLAEFERQFAVHCDIAKAHGDYKISVHSGSDKFSAYPIIGKHTSHRVHVKTAGTSWLEAIRAVAEADPALYRDTHQLALDTFPEALKLYHVTPDLDSIPEPSTLSDNALTTLLDNDAARQLLHVTYGGILKHPEFGPRFLAGLDAHEETYYKHLERHFVKHLSTLGLNPIA